MGQPGTPDRPVPPAGDGAHSLNRGGGGDVAGTARPCRRASAPSGRRWPSTWSASGSSCRSCPSTPSAFTPPRFQATLLVAAFSAASFVCSPLWGRVSDRFGRKPVLLVSLAGTAVGSLHHRAGRRPGRAAGGPDHRRGVGRQRLGGPGGRGRPGQSRRPAPAVRAARRGVRGRVRGRPGLGLAGGPRRTAAALFPGRRHRHRQHRRRRPPAARDPSGRTPAAGQRRPGPHRRPGRWRRGGAPAGGGILRPGRLQRLRGDLRPLRRSAISASGSPRRPRSSPWSGPPSSWSRAAWCTAWWPGSGSNGRCSAASLANGGGLALLAAARSWALAAPALLGLTVGQGLVQTTMVTQRGRPGRTRAAGPGTRGPAVGRRAGPGGRAGRRRGPARMRPSPGSRTCSARR